MLWLRVLCGLFFLGWFGCVLWAGWQALRPLPPPEDWESRYGRLDPHSDEFRRLILK